MESDVKVLVDGLLSVDYAQFYLVSGDEVDLSPENAFRDQVNGLCGAAVPGALYLVTGLRFGLVGLRVELHVGEPQLADGWEEVVEASFTPSSEELNIASVESEELLSLSLPVADYRVRYSARGMDQGHDEDQLYEGVPVDFYLLQFWPAPPTADRIIRQTSDAATYWHRANRQRPLPPAEEQAEDQRVADQQNHFFRTKYAGHIPNARLRAVDAYVAGLLTLDRDLLLAMSELDDPTLREVARWAALKAVDVAGLTNRKVVAAAVAALKSGRPLPAPFDDAYSWYEVADSVTPYTHVPHLPGFRPFTSSDYEPQPDDDPTRELGALSTLSAVSGDDPLQAAITTVESAAITYGGNDYTSFMNELRAAFPGLANTRT